MTKIIALHSFRGGTGKSNISANLAYLLFAEGKRVGVIDGDIASPGMHILFQVQEDSLEYNLNDFLWNQCPIEQTAFEILEKDEGRLFLIPSSLSAPDIAKILREGYSAEKLIDGLHALGTQLGLDYLIIDTHPGINEETLLAISISDHLIVIMRPDNQDYQGTAVTIELAKKLEVPRISLVVNKCLPSMDKTSIEKQANEAYGVCLLSILPFCEDVVLLGSSGIFTKVNPDHSFTSKLKELVSKICEEK